MFFWITFFISEPESNASVLLCEIQQHMMPQLFIAYVKEMKEGRGISLGKLRKYC